MPLALRILLRIQQYLLAPLVQTAMRRGWMKCEPPLEPFSKPTPRRFLSSKTGYDRKYQPGYSITKR
jgi:hypothetical protein